MCIRDRIYIDGLPANGASLGIMPVSASLSNSGNFLVGKNKDGNFFAGTIDFVRISKGTLAAAKTTIEELCKWEFNGPFPVSYTHLDVYKRQILL